MPPGVADRTSILDQLLVEIQQRGGTKATSMPPVGPYMHGPDGLWSQAGLERPVISTRVQPRGLAGQLPARSNNSMNPLYPYLTGFVEGTGSQPDATCDDCPTPGPMKNCFQTALFGRYCYQTRTLDITRMGQIINRGEFTDLMIWNDPIGGPANPPHGLTHPATTPGQINLNNEASVRFAEVGVAFQTKLMKQIWEGNPTNNTAGGGYREFVGLDILIGTGKRDAVTGAVCPSLDSLIVPFNAAADNTDPDNNLVNVLSYTFRSLKSLASRTGLDPVRFAMVMREEVFYELTAQWPCNYLTYRCIQLSSNVVGNFDMGDAIAMRDAMRNGFYLVIDGARVDVIVDDALPMTGNASDIVIVPLTVQGNKAVLFWEYFDWNGPGAALNAATVAQAPLMANYYWTDGGQYIWHMKPPVNWCVQWIGLIEPRLILLTPHLAARIEGVQISPLMTPRQPFPTDPYYVNGGVTDRNTAPSFYRSVPASEQTYFTP
jgi:hypothetical protein